MRLLNPFAGYRLANGIHVLHLAMFAASNICYMFDSNPDDDRDVTKAWKQVRIAHIAVCMLEFAAHFLSQETELDKEENKLKIESMQKAENDVERLKMQYKKSNIRKSLAQVCVVISVFQYSVAVFYAQLALLTKFKECLKVEN